MKIYEEVARLEVKEAIQNGVSAQTRKRMLKANSSQPELTAEQRDELFRTLFSEERPSGRLEPKPRLSVLVYIALSLGLVLAITAAAQAWLLT